MALLVNVDLIPGEMKVFKNWVLWKLEKKKDKTGKVEIDSKTGKPKLTKVPYQKNGKHARTNDPDTWDSYNYIKMAFIKRGDIFTGIGFVMSEDVGFVGIDFDHVRDPKTGEWNKEALEEIKALNSYTELSPSGSGCHVFVKGTMPAAGKRKTQPDGTDREMYQGVHFLTVTGNRIEGSPNTINGAQEKIDFFYNKWISPVKKLPEKKKKSPELSDEAVLNKCKIEANADKFNSLYTGNIKGFPSQSEADLSLCSKMAFYTQDKKQLNKLFCGSELYREKWNREDYGAKTLEKAISGLTEVYDPKNKGTSALKIVYSPDILKNIQVPKNGREKLQAIYEFIKGNLMSLSKSEANAIIITDIKEHFHLSRDEITNIKQFYKEEANNRHDGHTELSKKWNTDLEIGDEFKGLYTLQWNAEKTKITIHYCILITSL